MINRAKLTRPALPALGVGGLALLIASLAVPAAAQTVDQVGTRAQGMGGAFVAVADDASATWWNPAGLASGAYFSGILERGQIREPADPAPRDPAGRNGAWGFAVAYPALGLSYYRLRVSATVPPDSIGAVEPDRQDQGPVAGVLQSAAISAFGVTVGQSIGDYLVLASSIRLLRAGAVVSTDPGGADALDRADDLEVPRHTRGDLDVGAMLRFGAVRVGGVVKHVGEPGFGDGPDRLVLARQARAGVAVTRGRTGVFDSLIGAVDVDLTSTATVLGDVRRVAAGGEAALLRNRVAVRGGVNLASVGEGTWSPSVGASLALRSGLFVDGAVAPGSGGARAGWSMSLRSSF